MQRYHAANCTSAVNNSAISGSARDTSRAESSSVPSNYSLNSRYKILFCSSIILNTISCMFLGQIYGQMKETCRFPHGGKFFPLTFRYVKNILIRNHIFYHCVSVLHISSTAKFSCLSFHLQYSSSVYVKEINHHQVEIEHRILFIMEQFCSILTIFLSFGLLFA